MSIFELVNEWDDISSDRKILALEKIMDYIISDIEEHDEVAMSIFNALLEYESEDYFGTEGFNA